MRLAPVLVAVATACTGTVQTAAEPLLVDRTLDRHSVPDSPSPNATSAVSLPHRDQVLAAGQLAFRAWALQRPRFNVGPGFNCTEGMDCNDCHWTGSTFLLGVMEWYHATGDAQCLEYARRWANYYNYTVCGERPAHTWTVGAPASSRQEQKPLRQKVLRHNINHQLSGAIFVELFALDGNVAYLESTAAVLGAEIDDPSTDNYWSWVDAIHMAMNTYARMGNATGDTRYFSKQFANFNASVLTAADGQNKSNTKDPTATAFGFWNASEQLFYRDTRFLGTDVFWSRGNGWAFAALVAALQYGNAEGITRITDPHYRVYLRLFRALAAKLTKLQPKDGAWRASLLNPSAFPVPETSGTAEFVFGMAWGINTGLLPAVEYTPVVARAWSWLEGTALHKDSGLVGFCQPGGDQPENNFNSSSTTNFCVGQFMLAAAQMLKLLATAR